MLEVMPVFPPVAPPKKAGVRPVGPVAPRPVGAAISGALTPVSGCLLRNDLLRLATAGRVTIPYGDSEGIPAARPKFENPVFGNGINNYPRIAPTEHPL